MEETIKVAAGIVVNKDKVLIIQRAIPEEGTDGSILKWTFPGGKVLENEAPEKGALREVLNETGYTVTLNKQISERDHPHFPVHMHYFACDLVDVEPKSELSAEIAEVKWVKPTELKDYFTTDFDPNVRKYLGLK